MKPWAPKSDLALAVFAAGFLYDPDQDIIYSYHDAWQRKLGYTWPYDVAAAGLQMIIDCEPFYFNYSGRAWLIELWKGQYGLETGAEIGVYRDDVVGSDVRGDPGARFYACVKPQDQLMMKYTLYRNGQKLFKRGPESHWWLTGFHWGVYTANTHHLKMDLEIAFPATEMREAFTKAVTARGYNPTVNKPGNTVAFTFQIPRSRQPASRTILDGGAQGRNLQLVAGYDLLKKALHLTSNDPNGFSQLDGPVNKSIQAVAPVASAVRSRASGAISKLEAASPAAKKIHKAAAAAVDKLHHELPDAAATAYREIYTFFGSKAWRCNRSG